MTTTARAVRPNTLAGLLVVAAALLMGCRDLASSRPTRCLPGEQIECECAGGTISVLFCGADGTPGACACGYDAAVIDAPETCLPGYANCDGTLANLCEVTIATDDANCGACGNACTMGQRCIDGTCQCETSEMLCEGRCINTLWDDANCGACGHACGVGEECSVGACRVACALTVGDACTFGTSERTPPNCCHRPYYCAVRPAGTDVNYCRAPLGGPCTSQSQCGEGRCLDGTCCSEGRCDRRSDCCPGLDCYPTNPWERGYCRH